MAKNLVPLLVVIGLKANGKGGVHHDYPDFNSLACVKDAGMDWSHYVDVHGTGWLYDHSCGHSDERISAPEGVVFNSPEKQWLGVLMVPEEFAEQAELAFSDQVEPLSEEELETFYNQFHSARMPDNVVDDNVIKAITAKQAAGVKMTSADLAALDEKDPTSGIVANEMKTFAGFKAKKNLTVVERVRETRAIKTLVAE